MPQKERGDLMGLTEDYYSIREKKKKKEEEEREKAYEESTSLSDQYHSLRKGKDDIAPVKTATTTVKTATTTVKTAKNTGSNDSNKDEEEAKKDLFGLDLFQAPGVFDDGWQFGDVTKTILGTVGDIGIGVSEGVFRTVEGLADLRMYGVAGVADLLGNDEYAKFAREGAKLDATGYIVNDAKEELDKYSVSGDTTTGVANALGQIGLIYLTGGLGAAAGLGTVGTTALTSGLIGLSSTGSGMSEAYQSGATDEEAVTYGLIAGASDAFSEMLFGGLGKGIKGIGFSKGLSSADDVLAKNVSGMFKNQIAKNFAEFGVKASAEGVEEVLAGIGQAWGKSITYRSEEELGEIIKDENLLEQFIVGAVTSGIAQSGVVPGMSEGSLKEANKTGRDFITGLNANEQSVVDKEYENRIADAEKNGKIDSKEKSKIYDAVMNDMEKGYISTDTIGEVLGGESYEAYKSSLDQDESLRKEYDTVLQEYNTLNKMKFGDMTGEQQDRRAELKAQLDELKAQIESEDAAANRNQLKQQLDSEVFSLVKDGRLAESYNERARRGQAFEADLSKYNDAQKAIVQKAIDSGFLNNTNRTHEFVDLVAKVSADKGVLFDFTTNEKLKESGFALNGKTINGYVTKDGITVNMDSAKAVNSVVGHEITHVLEGTELYTELQQAVKAYAEAKGDYKGRYATLTELYKGIEGADIDAELTADLVGDYLFTDSDFINRLSVEHRNVFQKIYDEIKYLYKVATAGSKEARELEKVKRAFDKAYKEGGKSQTGDTKYSVSYTTDNRAVAVIENDIFDGKFEELSESERIKIVKDAIKGFRPGVPVSGRLIGVSRKSAGHFTNSDYTDIIRNNDQKLYEDKLNIAQNIDDVIYASTDYINEKPKHPRNDNITQFARGNVLLDIGGAKYEAKVLVGYTSMQEMVLYDVQDLTSAQFDMKEKKVQPKLAGNESYTRKTVTPSTDIIAENSEKSSGKKYSLADNTGKQLSKGQQEYFKDSKMRDDNGNLMVMYHGSQDAGFHTFDSRFSDDDTSFFFVDNNDAAASYSGTSETYEARTIRTAEDMNAFIAEIGSEGYEVVEQDGKFILLYEGDKVAESNTAKGIYDEFCWYEGVGEGDANYKVYLNLKNPLVVDANGRNWNNISREFSQEVYDRYKSLTDSEKTALAEIAGWGEYGIFKDEILSMARAKANGQYHDTDLASAYEKLGGANTNFYDAFSIASDDFSDDALREFAVKQMNTRDYAKMAKEQGYDGVIFKNIVDLGGYSNGSEGAATVAVAFDSNQIKSVANTEPTADADIRYSLSEYTAEEKKAHNDAVLEHFGKTYNWAETGYLLLDGTKLDLSGKHEGAPGGYRTVDHRDIVDALGDDYGNGEYSGSLVQFMSEGNIRIIPECNGINLSVKPTKAQEQALSSYIAKYRGEVLLDIDDLNGNTVVSVEYPYGTYYTKVLNDIREWFDNGKKPENAGSYSLTKEGDTPRKYGNYNVYGKDLQIKTETEQQGLAPIEPIAPIGDVLPDDFAPIVEDDSTAEERLASLNDTEAPPEMEAPYQGDSQPVTADDPFEDRYYDEVGNRKVKAYMYENPEVKPFFQEAAEAMKSELFHSTKGQRFYNDDLYYETNGEKGFWGEKRWTSDDIAYLLDYGYTYAEIEKGLNAIIEDNGAENNAVSKRIEFALNDRLMNGYTDFQTGYEVPANQDYINLLNEKQINEYNQEAFDRFMETADEYAPIAEEDIAPVANTVAPVAETVPKERYEAIRPKRQPTKNMDNGGRMIRIDTENTRPGEKQRKWVGTSTESEAVDGKVLPEDLDQDLIHYQPIPNKVTLGKANARLNSMGYESAVSYFNSQFANKNVSLDDIALGERLIQEAVKKGDTKTAGELIQNVSILGTELGQKVQALSIIKRLTPEGQLKMLQKTVERGKTKGDKSFEGVELTQEMIDKILAAYGKDGSYDQAKLNKAVEDVKQELADNMNVTFMEKANAWRYLSMLGNPKTHIRNIVSNVAMRGTVAVKNVVARSIESIAPIENRTKTFERASETVKAFSQNTAKEMQDILSDGSKYSEEASIKAKRQIFKNEILNKMYDFNSDWLSKEDWWFSRPAFVNSLSEFLTANGIRTEQDIKNNPEIVEKAKTYATEQSQIATFRQYSWLSNKINDIERRNAATNIAVGAILPFKKTPINIAKTGLNYSPLGFAKTLTYDISQVKNGKMEASTLVDHLAQNITGTGLALVGYLLAQSGLLSGGGEDDKEGKYDYQLGEQSYAVNIGGKSYSLSWLSPVAMPLFVGANAYEQLVEGKEWNGDVVIETLSQTLDPLSEMSFLSGLDSVLSSYDTGFEKFAGIGQSMAQNYITQFVPTLSSQVATVMDDTKRSTKVGGDSGFKFVDETINKLKLKIPVLRQTLEPSTDIWGNDVKQTENVMTRAFETFLAPYATKDNIATEVDEEIKLLYSETGDTGLIPSVPYNYVNYNGEKYNMSAKQFTDFKKAYGQTAFGMLEELFDTSTYQNATDEERTDMVNRVYDYARDEAKLAFLAENGVEYTNATQDGDEYYKENPIKGAIENDLPVDEYSFSVEYPEKYSFFKSNGISYRDYADADEDGKRAYSWAYENPGKFTLSKAISDDFMTYYGYKSEMNDFDAKDENGETVSGLKKERVIEYVNNLDLDYGQKIILFRSMYDSKDDKAAYNSDIVDYLNSREDISYEEMETILKELGFTVYSDGTITW